jgi:site-specific DNA-methyltransferase (adenine-specific)
VIVWSKGNDPGMGDLSMPWGLSHEEIYVLGTGFIGKRESSVITMNKPPANNRPDHPTPKPIGLMELLINKTDGLIADPFAGSGATLIAAKNLGRKAIGVELEEKYCELIAKRLSQNTFDFSQLEAKPKETYTIESLI